MYVLIGLFLLLFLLFCLNFSTCLLLIFAKLLIFADKIDKAKEILKVKEDVDVLMSQCETYLKESYGQKISELQEELRLKDKQLESCQDQITKDKDNLKNSQLEAEKLNNEFQQLDTSVLGNV